MASSVSTKVCDMKREEEIMNDTKRLGKVLKEGTIMFKIILKNGHNVILLSAKEVSP